MHKKFSGLEYITYSFYMNSNILRIMYLGYESGSTFRLFFQPKPAHSNFRNSERSNLGVGWGRGGGGGCCTTAGDAGEFPFLSALPPEASTTPAAIFKTALGGAACVGVDG
jgi:hypothetical protein